MQRFMETPSHVNPVTRHCRSRTAAAVSADPLGAVKAGQLSSLVLAAAVQRWQAEGVADSLVRARLNLLVAAMTWAVRHELLAHDVLTDVPGVSNAISRVHTSISAVHEVLSIAREDMVRSKRDGGSRRERRPGVWEIRVTVGIDPTTGRSLLKSFTHHGDAASAERRQAELAEQ